MKEDYLWDKTGSDESVEKLENALRIFSHDNDAAFAVPVIATAPQKWSLFKGFRPLLFAPASVVIAAIAWGAWMQASRITGPSDVGFASVSPIESPAAPVIDKFEPAVEPPPAPAPQIIKAAYRPRLKKRTERTVLRTIPAEGPKPEFTKEEIYAYDQLVLALSITSDKLGQVREKAIGENNNSEEK